MNTEQLQELKETYDLLFSQSSGTTWTSGNNNYVIERTAPRRYAVRRLGQEIGDAKTFKSAARLAGGDQVDRLYGTAEGASDGN